MITALTLLDIHFIHHTVIPCKFQTLFTTAFIFLCLQTIGSQLPHIHSYSILFCAMLCSCAKTHTSAVFSCLSENERKQTNKKSCALQCIVIHMTLSGSCRDEQPQELIKVPGHKVEDAEKNWGAMHTTVYYPTFNGERCHTCLTIALSPDTRYPH